MLNISCIGLGSSDFDWLEYGKVGFLHLGSAPHCQTHHVALCTLLHVETWLRVARWMLYTRLVSGVELGSCGETGHLTGALLT